MTAYDRMVSVCFIFVGILFWRETGGLQYNCYVFPRILAVFLCVLSLIMFLLTFFKKEAKKEEDRSGDDLKYIVICLALVIGWIYILDIAGFVVASVVFLSVLTLVLDLEPPAVKRTLYTIAVYALVVIIFWLSFHKLLLVPLPQGFFI